MILFQQLGVSQTEMQQLNYGRLFLQVTTVSDITTGDGTQILESAAKGGRCKSRTSNIEWPNQPQPSENSGRHGDRLLR